MQTWMLFTNSPRKPQKGKKTVVQSVVTTERGKVAQIYRTSRQPAITSAALTGMILASVGDMIRSRFSTIGKQATQMRSRKYSAHRHMPANTLAVVTQPVRSDGLRHFTRPRCANPPAQAIQKTSRLPQPARSDGIHSGICRCKRLPLSTGTLS